MWYPRESDCPTDGMCTCRTRTDWELDGEPIPDPHVPKNAPAHILRKLSKSELLFWIETGELPTRIAKGGGLQSTQA